MLNVEITKHSNKTFFCFNCRKTEFIIRKVYNFAENSQENKLIMVLECVKCKEKNNIPVYGIKNIIFK